MKKRKSRGNGETVLGAGNPVFKYMEDINKPKTFHDRKKQKKKGYNKHKSRHNWRDYSFLSINNCCV